MFWDNWLVWKAMDAEIPVVDASQAVLAVHQNHDYAHHPQGAKGVWFGEEQRQNLQLCGGHGHLRTIADAPTLLTPSGFAPNRLRHVNLWMRTAKRMPITACTRLQTRFWHPFLDRTRPLRRTLALRRRTLQP
jgi:hypothetical protein